MLCCWVFERVKSSELQDRCSEFSKVFVLDRAQIVIRQPSHWRQTRMHKQTFTVSCLCCVLRSLHEQRGPLFCRERQRGVEKHVAHLLAAFHSVSAHSLHQKNPHGYRPGLTRRDNLKSLCSRKTSCFKTPLSRKKKKKSRALDLACARNGAL